MSEILRSQFIPITKNPIFFSPLPEVVSSIQILLDLFAKVHPSVVSATILPNNEDTFNFICGAHSTKETFRKLNGNISFQKQCRCYSR